MNLRSFVIALLLATTAGPVRAEVSLEAARQSWLIDNTRSDLGGEFFRAFADAWRREARGDLVISIEERMGRQFAHQINVWVGNRLLAQTLLYPGQRARVGSIAQAAAATAEARLGQWRSGAGEML